MASINRLAGLSIISLLLASVAAGSADAEPRSTDLVKRYKTTILKLLDGSHGGILMLHPESETGSPLFLSSADGDPERALASDGADGYFERGFKTECSLLTRDEKGRIRSRVMDCATVSRLAAATRRLGQMDATIETLRAELSRQSDQGQLVASRVSGLEAQLVMTETSIAETREAVVALSRTMVEYERQAATMSRAIAKWPELFRQFRSFTVALKTSFDGIVERYNQQLVQLVELQTRLKASLVRIGA